MSCTFGGSKLLQQIFWFGIGSAVAANGLTTFAAMMLQDSFWVRGESFTGVAQTLFLAVGVQYFIGITSILKAYLDKRRKLNLAFAILAFLGTLGGLFFVAWNLFLMFGINALEDPLWNYTFSAFWGSFVCIVFATVVDIGLLVMLSMYFIQYHRKVQTV